MPKITGRYVACLAMVGVGALIGAILGGNSNAARSPDDQTGVARVEPEVQIATTTTPSAAAPTTISPAAASPPAPSESAESARPEPAPAAVVAMRFPPRWHMAAQAAHASVPEALAYAAAPASAPSAARPAATDYRLASVDPAPLPPKRAKPPVRRDPTLFNDAQLASIKKRLNLSPQQEQYWPQVEEALRAISFKLARQQDVRRPVRGSQAAMIDPNSPEVARLKAAAFPLIMSLRSEQKEEVRQLAHTMGLGKVAAMF